MYFNPGAHPNGRPKKALNYLSAMPEELRFGLEGTEMKTPGKKGQVIRLNIPEGYERRSKKN